MEASLIPIENVKERIKPFEKTPLDPERGNPQGKKSTDALPRLSAPLKSEGVLGRAPQPAFPGEWMESRIGNVAKYYGQSHQPNTPFSQAKKLFFIALDKILTPEQQQWFSPAGLVAAYHACVSRLLHLPYGLGMALRQTFERRASKIVLGSPRGELEMLLFSIQALTSLAVASLHEDTYGQVAKDVPTLIRSFMDTISKIEMFMQELEVHWTDLDFQGRKSEDVEKLLEGLKGGLRELVVNFGGYAQNIGLTEAEMEKARKITGERRPLL